MLNLSEKEMRLLVGIVLDAAAKERKIKCDEDSPEMENAIAIISLSDKIVKICNEMYPTKGEDPFDTMWKSL
jgi:hypothetical protein